MKLMLPKDYADYVGTTVQSVYSKIRNNKLPTEKKNNTMFVVVEDFKEEEKNSKSNCKEDKQLIKEYKKLLKSYKKRIVELEQNQDKNYMRLEQLFQLQLQVPEVIEADIMKKKKKKKKKK